MRKIAKFAQREHSTAWAQHWSCAISGFSIGARGVMALSCQHGIPFFRIEICDTSLFTTRVWSMFSSTAWSVTINGPTPRASPTANSIPYFKMIVTCVCV